MSSGNRQALDSAMQLAVQRHQAGDVAAAETHYRSVLSLDATHPGALHNLGLIRLQHGDTAGALELLAAAVRQRPGEPTFQFNHGLAHQSAGDIASAAAAYRKAVAANPAYRKAWENLGVVLQDLQQHDEAIAAYRRALAIDAASVLARQNLGNALRALGRLDDAEAEYRAVLDQQPLQADAAVQLGATQMMRGDFAGWDLYEWRYWSGEALAGGPPWPLPLPKWDGGALEGRTLHVYGEQGIGDEIMFASCVADAARRATRLVLWCEPRLAPLFARSFPGVDVRGKPRGGLAPLLGPEPDAVRCSLASLPRLLRRSAADFPGTAFLAADPVATAAWRGRFATLGGQRVIGISWRGGGAPRAREARSIALAGLAPLFALEGVRIVDLQYGDHREEITRFNDGAANPLARFDGIDALRDMDGFAAAVAAVDALVCVDNSTAHLAGALGVPTLLLLPFQADWRWQHGAATSPWYASLRLLWQREPAAAAWPEVIARAARTLSEITARTALPAHPAAPGTSTSSAPAAPRLDAPADVLLLNDTSCWYHWGCSCTSLALHEGLRARGLAVDPVHIHHLNALEPLPVTAAQFDDDGFFEAFRANNPALVDRIGAASMVLVNGEGSLHDFGTTARALLYLVHVAATRLHRRVHIVNHSCYPAATGESPALDALYRNIYSNVAYVAVREETSLARMAALGIRATASFDCLPLFAARHPPAVARDARRVVMAGCVQLDARMVDLLARMADEVLATGRELVFLAGASAWLAQDDVALLAALQPRLRGHYRLVAATSEAEWLGTIAGAGLLISGRFHHSIAAACVGTPLLVAGSNTRKNEGLVERLGLARDAVWLDATQPEAASARLAAMLRDPGAGRVATDRLAHLRELATRNFDHLPAR